MIRRLSVLLSIAAVPFVVWWLVLPKLPDDPLCEAPAKRADRRWKEHVDSGLCLYWPDGMALGAARDSLRRVVATAREDSAEFMGVRDTAPPIRMVLVHSRDELRRITGREAWGTTYPDGMVFLVFDGRVNTLGIRHEVMHALNRTLWPPGGNESWIVEGLGVVGGGHCGGYSPRAVAAFLLEQGMLPSLESLEASFSALDEIVGHLTAAAFVQFTRAEYGAGGLERLWVGGLGALAGTEADRQSLKDPWFRYLQGVPMGDRLPSLDVIRSGCRADGESNAA